MVGYFDANVWRSLGSLTLLDPTGGLGEFLQFQMAAGKIITPKDVYGEVQPNDKLWLDLVPDSVRDLDDKGLICLTEIVNSYPDFLDPNKPSGRDADQPLVAMALAHHRSGISPAMVVTQERAKKPTEQRWHIPDACSALGLQCGAFPKWLALSGYRISVEPIR